MCRLTGRSENCFLTAVNSRIYSLMEATHVNEVLSIFATVADAESNPLLDELDRIGLPYVLAHNDTTCRKAVSVDNRRAARDGVRALIERGHRRVLMLAGSFAASDRARQRYRGYADALLDAGLTPQPPLELDFNAEELPATLLAHFSDPASRPTALFCGNDRLAIGALSLQIALLGFLFARGERTAVKDRRGQVGTEGPDAARAREELVDEAGLLRVLSGQADRG